MIVFITGATVGFGAAMVKKFIQNGDKVIATGRRIALLENLKNELGDNVFPLKLDVRDQKSVSIALTQLPEAFKKIDVLINNAGLALGLDPAQRASIDDWRDMVDTNINGLLYCTHTILPGMVERNNGHIINLGSVAGEFPYPGGHVYGATKAFVHQLSLNLRADLVNSAVRVTCIEPGLCSGTEFSKVRFKGDEQKAQNVYQGVKALTADDIAETVLWVATRPAHVNINTISLMPTQQAFAGFAINREK